MRLDEPNAQDFGDHIGPVPERLAAELLKRLTNDRAPELANFETALRSVVRQKASPIRYPPPDLRFKNLRQLDHKNLCFRGNRSWLRRYILIRDWNRTHSESRSYRN
jgi:hypothetical protein